MQSGDISSAAAHYSVETHTRPRDWWPPYRAAWCFNHLEMPDSALVYARAAFELAPGNERCLSELMKALSRCPESVLDFAPLVSGGGVCRYRLARAELELGLTGGESLAWLFERFEGDSGAAAADAGCWLSILFPKKGPDFILRSVELMPDEQFYRSILVDRLLSAGRTEEAVEHFRVLEAMGEHDLSFWQTASAVLEALGDRDGAIEASRNAYGLRMTPSTGADLGWKLYFRGRDLFRENSMAEALAFLREAGDVWDAGAPWALRADSLIDLCNEFTSISSGFGEPF